MAQKVKESNRFKNRRKHPVASAGFHGFYRVKIVDPDGRIAGDSGWNHNLITNLGLSEYITKNFMRTAGSCAVTYMAIGSTATLLATNATALTGQCASSHMVTVSTGALTTRASSTAGDTARFLATFPANGFAAATTIAAAGLHSANTGTIFAGGTFASSAVATNQAINCTYDVVFVASTS